jgi:hypothetical protein
MREKGAETVKPMRVAEPRIADAAKRQIFM